MRKNNQKQILELLKTFKEAQSAGLYGDAQDGALSVGAFIEQIEGEGNPRIAGTIALLEEYCELLFGASKGEVGGKALRKHLIKLENSVRDGLAPDKIEVVFVSYNASMSDSILSIHAAAKADPACDAVWLPVPYFEKNRDGSFGAMHYEGAECYGDTDCADWREYDIEARRPDVIFTFNPYDASNLVTSVHPDFYCERLRGLTDLLVYVPYFVTADADGFPEHFCTVAGCVYAHKVVVQSEKIRDTYIRAFKKAYGSRLGNPEDKFVALGSPKFDAVLRAKRENCELPDAWRKLIGGRKVVFYNTSVGAILAGGAQYLKKLRHVLDVFREHDDAILWWRPHPLSEATCDSMRPDLADEYRRIVAGYRREGFGIYDDTADLHRAIAFSDAYYGDGSSVLELYKATGKPAMMQNVGYTADEDATVHPYVVLSYFDETFIYFSELFHNAFCRIDRRTNEVQFLGHFPTKNKRYLYLEIVRIQNKLYFAPGKANEIAVYDLDELKFCESVKINAKDDGWQFGKLKYQDNGEGFEYFYFECSIVFGDRVYFIPYKYPAIVCLNTVTNEVSYFDDFLTPLSKAVNGEALSIADGLLNRPIKISETKFLASSYCSNIVVEFDTATNTSEIHTVGRSNYRFSSIAQDGENYWLMPRAFDTPIVKWNPRDGILRKIELDETLKAEPIMPFYRRFIYGNYVFVFSPYSVPVIKINRETYEVTELKNFNSKFIEDSGIKVLFSGLYIKENTFYLFQHQTNCLLVHDAETEETVRRTLHMTSDLTKAYEQNIKEIGVQSYNKHGFWYEDRAFVTLDRLLTYLSNDDCFGWDSQNQRNGTAGQNIFDFIKHRVLR